LYDDSDHFNEFGQDSDIDIFDHIDPDSNISGPDLSNSCSNSDAGQVSANVGVGDSGNDDGGGCSGGYNDKGDNKNWALWDNNNHDFYMIPFHASSGYKPPQNGQMPVFKLFLVQLYFKK
jgi:hypothetical protein